MTQVLFRAEVVGVDEESDTLIVGFTDDESDPSDYLILQRGLPPNDDDGVHLEHGDQIRGGFGGMLSCSLAAGRIELTVSDAMAARLETEATFAIEFAPDQTTLRRVQAGLARVFSGTRCKLEVAGADAP